jgi:5-methylcytosine-specific restriction protein A
MVGCQMTVGKEYSMYAKWVGGESKSNWSDNMSEKFYKSKKWKTKRQSILRRDEYLCRECKRYGKTTPATTVHHILPIEQRPDLKLSSLNLISLCNECHNKMHDRHTNELTNKGLDWVERVYKEIEPT